MESVVLDAARRYRKENPGLGCTKLHRIVSASMAGADMPGRDSLIPEPDRRRGPEPSEPDMGRGHHLCRDRRGRVLPVAGDGRLLTQDRGLGPGADSFDPLSARGPTHGSRYNPARARARPDTPLRQGLPILQLRVYSRNSI